MGVDHLIERVHALGRNVHGPLTYVVNKFLHEAGAHVSGVCAREVAVTRQVIDGRKVIVHVPLATEQACGADDAALRRVPTAVLERLGAYELENAVEALVRLQSVVHINHGIVEARREESLLLCHGSGRARDRDGQSRRVREPRESDPHAGGPAAHQQAVTALDAQVLEREPRRIVGLEWPRASPSRRPMPQGRPARWAAGSTRRIRHQTHGPSLP